MMTYEDFEELVKRIEEKTKSYYIDANPIKNGNESFRFQMKIHPLYRGEGTTILNVFYRKLEKEFAIAIRNRVSIVIHTKETFYHVKEICELISQEVVLFGKENKNMRMQLLFQNIFLKEPWRKQLDEIKQRRRLGDER